MHVKLESNLQTQKNIIAYCAASRVAKEENIEGKIPGLFGKLQDERGEFDYSCYVTSPYLDENVRSDRTEFEIVEDNSGGLFEEFQISFKEIREGVLNRSSIFLADLLYSNKQKGKKRVEEFVENVAPRYRPILSRIPDEKLYINPKINDKELDIELHKQLSELEREILTEGHELMDPLGNEKIENYQKRLKDYISKVSDIKKSDLVNYVSHRKIVLDILQKAISTDKSGEYSREETIHTLIMPMGKDSNEISPDNNNLWLLDERLSFHNYLASDKSISSLPITQSSDPKEPDICSINIFDNPILVSESNDPPLASITVIEIKRPMRNDAKEGENKDPIEQALGYLERIRNGQVMTASGRPIPNSEEIPGFCYIVCDLTTTMVNRCKMHTLTVTSDKMGYFGYNHNFKSYIEVISFDRLVNGAKQRNRAFFDKLGFPSK